MKVLKAFIFLAILVAATMPASAQKNIIAEFVDGTVEFKAGSVWRPVAIGESFTDAQLKSVRLGKKSYAEFSSRGRKLSLSSAGIFDIPALISKPAPAVSSGLGGRVQRLLAEKKPKGAGVAMGVRAERKDDTLVDPALAIGDEASFLASGSEAVLNGDFANGEAYLLRAWSSAEGSDEVAVLAGISYYLGLCNASQGKTAPALKALRSSQWYWDPELAQDYLALQLSLEIQSNAVPEAKALAAQGASKQKELGLDQEFTNDLKRLATEL